jgi:hypothetical protein
MRGARPWGRPRRGVQPLPTGRQGAPGAGGTDGARPTHPPGWRTAAEPSGSGARPALASAVQGAAHGSAGSGPLAPGPPGAWWSAGGPTALAGALPRQRWRLRAIRRAAASGHGEPRSHVHARPPAPRLLAQRSLAGRWRPRESVEPQRAGGETGLRAAKPLRGRPSPNGSVPRGCRSGGAPPAGSSPVQPMRQGATHAAAISSPGHGSHATRKPGPRGLRTSRCDEVLAPGAVTTCPNPAL